MSGAHFVLLSVDGVHHQVNLSQRCSYVEPNPKLAGTEAAKRYRRYMKATTLEEAKRKGALGGDLRFDFSHGFLRLENFNPNKSASSKSASSKPASSSSSKSVTNKSTSSASAAGRTKRSAGGRAASRMALRRASARGSAVGSSGILRVVQRSLRSGSRSAAASSDPKKKNGARGSSVRDGVIHHVFSLGSRCLVARVLKDLNLRPYAGPLDWVYSNVEMVRRCVSDRFSCFLDTRNYVKNGHSWGHKVFNKMLGRGIVFPHHDPHTKDRVLFKRAVDRFHKVTRSSDRKLLILALIIGNSQELATVRGGSSGKSGAAIEQLFSEMKKAGMRNFELLVVLVVKPLVSDFSGARPAVTPGVVAGNSKERLVVIEFHSAGENTGMNFKSDADEKAFRTVVQCSGPRKRRFALKPDPLPPRNILSSERRTRLGEVQEPADAAGRPLKRSRGQ